MIEQRLKEWEQELKALPAILLEEEPSFFVYSGRWPRSRDNIYEQLNVLINFDFIKLNTIYSQNSKVETERGKHRSLEHIYRVFIAYFPKVTLFEVCDALYKLYKDKKVKTLVCPQIVKRTFFAYVDERNYVGQEQIDLSYVKEKISFKDITDYINEQNKNKEQASVA